MKAVLVIITIISFIFNIKADNSSRINNSLKELDNTLNKQWKYNQMKEEEIDNLHEKLRNTQNIYEKYEIYGDLFEAFNKYQMDSALFYVNQQKYLLHKNPNIGSTEDVLLKRAKVMSMMGMYKEAVETLNAIKRERLTQTPQLVNYYVQSRNIYGYMSDYSLSQYEKKQYRDQARLFQDSMTYIYDQTKCKSYVLLLADKLRTEGKHEEALKEIEKQFNDTTINKRLKGMLAYNVAEAYQRLGDDDNYLYYLIQSAIYDLKLSIREYVALPKLALILYEKGDIVRAYNYLTCSMNDAVICNARLRTIETTSIYPIIDRAYRLKEYRNNTIKKALFTGITILILFLGSSIMYVKKQNRKLADARKALSNANIQLSAANEELSQLNQVKQQYLAYYLDQCTMYLDKLEDYRRSLSKLAINSKINELFKAIKSEQFIEEEREKFYKSFDETFLKLYPNFVEQFNNLLNDDEKIYPKKGELLCTEIRIFALIRLGISDSNKIARFLRYSINTIYIYRSKVRNKAKGDKNDFENQIMKIKE